MSVAVTYTCDRCRAKLETKGPGEDDAALWRRVRIDNLWSTKLGELHLCPRCTEGLDDYLESHRGTSEEL